MQQQNVYTDSRSLELIEQNKELRRNLGTVTVAQAAQEDGAQLRWWSKRDVWAILPDRRVPITGHCGSESVLGAGLVSNKELTKQLMAEAGVAVPQGRIVKSPEDALLTQKELGCPVVLKPVSGSMGDGVTVNITSEEDIRAAFRRASTSSAGVLLEQYIEGDEYRAHATPNECAGIFRRLLPSVIGDGESTIRELIKQKNELRQLNPTTRTSPIPIDDVGEGYLRRRDLSWNSVIDKDETVVVRDINGITSGGDSEECWDQVDEEVKKTAIGAVAAIPGMNWGGVDILVDKHTGAPYVMEVNTDASIHGSTYPVFGTPRDLGKAVWRLLREESKAETQDSLGSETVELERPEVDPEDGALYKSTLRDLMIRQLESDGWETTSHSPYTWSATKQGHDPKWFQTVGTAHDSANSVQPLRRRPLLRRLLQAADIQVPVARRVVDAKQLQAFRKKVNSEVELVPLRGTLGKGGSRFLPSGKKPPANLFAGNRVWLAQARPEGSRFRIMTTPEGPLAVIARAEQQRPRPDALNQVLVTAVTTVREIPQLRWAVVDVICAPSANEGAGDHQIFVEALSLNIRFRDDEELIAGSLTEALRTIIG